ncbi:MAG: hypothetical protein NC548_57130 [Lachnospiraceae bacterium]|nr:hypothetical protein [Lachnospiraceae bacterium]
MMKRLVIFLFAAITSMAAAQAGNWCEELIKKMNTYSGVDKTIRANRDPQTNKITTAVYDFKFSSKSLFNNIRMELSQHAFDSDYYSETGNETVLMRFTIDGQRWDCKLQSIGQGKQFLVTINQSGQPLQPASPSQKHNSDNRTQHSQTTSDKAAVEQNNRELEKAERERRQKLGL